MVAKGVAVANGADYKDRPFANFERVSFPVPVQPDVSQDAWDRIFKPCPECGDPDCGWDCAEKTG